MKKRIAIGICIGFALALVTVLAVNIRDTVSQHQRLYGTPRKAWRDAAIADITQRVNDMSRLTNQISEIKSNIGRGGSAWFLDGVLLMRDGQWIVCTNICTKQNYRIHDLFIARGSDGKWYYSDFHFCIGMITLDILGQLANLTDFIQACSLREFDGHSDECLQRTWDHKIRLLTPDR